MYQKNDFRCVSIKLVFERYQHKARTQTNLRAEVGKGVENRLERRALCFLHTHHEIKIKLSISKKVIH